MGKGKTTQLIEYPKIYRLGNRWVEGILDGEVIIQEKYDGSNFRIRRRGNGSLEWGTRHVNMSTNPFAIQARDSIAELMEKVPTNWIIFGEWGVLVLIILVFRSNLQYIHE